MKKSIIALFLMALFMMESGVWAQSDSDMKHIEKEYSKAIMTKQNKVDNRNMLKVLVNRSGAVLVNTGIVEDGRLKDVFAKFLRGGSRMTGKPEKMKKKIDLLGNVQVSQGVIMVEYDASLLPQKIKKALLEAFYMVRDEKAMLHFGLHYGSLSTSQRAAINELIPMKIRVEKYKEAGASDPSLGMDVEIKDEYVVPIQDIDVSTGEEYGAYVSVASVAVAEVEDEDIEEEIFMIVDTPPSFPGGDEALYRYLAENIKIPHYALENGFQGKVYLTFVVEKDGSLSRIRVLRDIGGGCGAEAVRVVKSMPKWIPGKQRGKPVRVQFNLPVNFRLPSKTE